MARPLRLLIPGGWYHVMNRGNRREALFRTDDDRRRFLGLVAELPERFRFELHAFVLMDNHYHLLLRTPEPNLSHGIHLLNVSYSSHFNWAHGQVGHVFQGRFKAVVIQDEKGACEVARYLHLNPVRIHGLGLGKAELRRAKVLGSRNPTSALITQRLRTLDAYRWSSWRVYSGAEPRPDWLETGLISRGSGGRTQAARKSALRRYTEAPVRQGELESPWNRLVGGMVLGDEDFAEELTRRIPGDREEQTEARRLQRASTTSWDALVSAAESILGRPWSQMVAEYGDWGRDGVIYVATRYGGFRLAEVYGRVPGLKYQAAAQGVRRFSQGLNEDSERQRFVKRLRQKCQ